MYDHHHLLANQRRLRRHTRLDRTEQQALSRAPRRPFPFSRLSRVFDRLSLFLEHSLFSVGVIPAPGDAANEDASADPVTPSHFPSGRDMRAAGSERATTTCSGHRCTIRPSGNQLRQINVSSSYSPPLTSAGYVLRHAIGLSAYLFLEKKKLFVIISNEKR